jgi:hypothetical protein
MKSEVEKLFIQFQQQQKQMREKQKKSFPIFWILLGSFSLALFPFNFILIFVGTSPMTSVMAATINFIMMGVGTKELLEYKDKEWKDLIPMSKNFFEQTYKSINNWLHT